jgi:hypothetical protein
MDQQQPEAPAYQPPIEQPAAVTTVSNKKRKILGLWLLIGPTALIVSSIILFAIVNFITSSMAPAPTDSELFAPRSPLESVMNIIMFLVGAISILTWLPGIIIGIILLTTQKKS